MSFKSTVKRIKDLKIQGAENVAIEAVTSLKGVVKETKSRTVPAVACNSAPKRVPVGNVILVAAAVPAFPKRVNRGKVAEPILLGTPRLSFT
jgi:phosphosulfolactate synthase (CoM biosynthesis protein A)